MLTPRIMFLELYRVGRCVMRRRVRPLGNRHQVNPFLTPFLSYRSFSGGQKPAPTGVFANRGRGVVHGSRWVEKPISGYPTDSDLACVASIVPTLRRATHCLVRAGLKPTPTKNSISLP
jgi:hypothetical protein